MKYHVSRDVGHLKFTKIKNPKSHRAREKFSLALCKIPIPATMYA